MGFFDKFINKRPIAKMPEIRDNSAMSSEKKTLEDQIDLNFWLVADELQKQAFFIGAMAGYATVLANLKKQEDIKPMNFLFTLMRLSEECKKSSDSVKMPVA